MAIETTSPTQSAEKTQAPLNSVVKGSHAVKVTELTDERQFFEYLVSCTCGTEGRFNTIEEAKSFVEGHFQRRGLR